MLATAPARATELFPIASRRSPSRGQGLRGSGPTTHPRPDDAELQEQGDDLEAYEQRRSQHDQTAASFWNERARRTAREDQDGWQRAWAA